jgi:hypothetical protein
MSIQWADDFSRYGTGAGSRTAMLEGLPYGNIGTVGPLNAGTITASPDPNDSGRAFQIGANNNDWPRDFRIALPSVVAGTLGVAFRAWLSNLPANEGQRCAIAGFQRANGDYMVYAQIEQNGAITIQGRVGNAITEIFDSINPIISPGSFNHYELVHDKAAGEGSLYINGVERVTYSGVDVTDNLVFINHSGRSSSTVGPTVWIKDLYIWDGSGTQNNTVAGTVIVRRLKVNGDVTLGDWVPSTGTTGTPLLAKNAPNDATYISGAASPLPAPSRFDLENLPPDITSVRGLISVIRTRKVDGGDANMQTGLTPDNGTNYDLGADRPITSAFSYYFDVSELDPASATLWSPSAVDDAQLRLDRTI